MPAGVVHVRQSICRRCDAPCAAYVAGEIDHANPSQQCPRAWSGRWGCYGRCGDGAVGRALPAFLERPRVVTAPGDAVAVVSAQAPAVQPLHEPTLTELATNFAGAVGRWAAGGFATVDADAYAARSAICDGCTFWDGSARLGLGKCKAPGCGCTSVKRWLATERCPLRKWPGEKQPLP